MIIGAKKIFTLTGSLPRNKSQFLFEIFRVAFRICFSRRRILRCDMLDWKRVGAFRGWLWIRINAAMTFARTHVSHRHLTSRQPLAALLMKVNKHPVAGVYNQMLISVSDSEQRCLIVFGPSCSRPNYGVCLRLHKLARLFWAESHRLNLNQPNFSWRAGGSYFTTGGRTPLFMV